MKFLDCLKRQREIFKGEEKHRCIDRESEHFRQFVEPDACHDCPVRKFAKKTVPCDKKPELAQPPVKQQPQVIQFPILNQPEGYPACNYRMCAGNGCSCSITGMDVNTEICNRCNEEVREVTASTLDALQNYYGAVRNWIFHGRPVRSKERQQEIFDQFCSKCEKYDPEKHACKVCGCKVAAGGAALKNKLAMATEGCPLGFFPADVK